jgi:hypothetical protein
MLSPIQANHTLRMGLLRRAIKRPEIGLGRTGFDTRSKVIPGLSTEASSFELSPMRCCP